MREHQDESLLDKVKHAFGMGDDREDTNDAYDAPTATGTSVIDADAATDVNPETDAELAADADLVADARQDGWAGVPEALYDDVATGDESAGAVASEPMGAGAEPYPADAPSGLGRNPGPAGSSQYEGDATPDDPGGVDLDAEGRLDPTRDEIVSTEFGGAYGPDDTPLPTSAAWDRGEAAPLPGDAAFGTDEELGEPVDEE